MSMTANHKDIEITQEGKVISRIVTGDNLREVIPCLERYRKVYIVHDRNITQLADNLSASVRNASPSLVGGILPIEATERTKDMETVLRICSSLLEWKADRDCLVLGIGGGITTDMVGFAASIYKRGVKFAFIPTTLLAQVDAAIGGKTGVNFLHYKNMIGVIRQPEFTFLCPEPLDSLPARDFTSGCAELLKTFILDNGPEDSWYDSACGVLQRIHESADGVKPFSKELMPFIHAAASVKAGVVSRDQFEKGERRLLNLGHTFAHAIEHLSASEAKNVPVTHGEAVAIGMILSAKLSAALGTAPRDLPGKLAEDFDRIGLPSTSPYPLSEMEKAMTLDKKAEGNIVHFVIPERIGHASIKDLTVKEAIGLICGPEKR